jgi:hypothetical protein
MSDMRVINFLISVFLVCMVVYCAIKDGIFMSMGFTVIMTLFFILCELQKINNKLAHKEG